MIVVLIVLGMLVFAIFLAWLIIGPYKEDDYDE
jgi:hypothetical protein